MTMTIDEIATKVVAEHFDLLKKYYEHANARNEEDKSLEADMRAFDTKLRLLIQALVPTEDLGPLIVATDPDIWKEMRKYATAADVLPGDNMDSGENFLRATVFEIVDTHIRLQFANV